MPFLDFIRQYVCASLLHHFSVVCEKRNILELNSGLTTSTQKLIVQDDGRCHYGTID